VRGAVAVWRDRSAFRYNKDVAGRGRAHFSAEQFARLERMLSSYPALAARRDGLL
jgi:hypothetical protein